MSKMLPWLRIVWNGARTFWWVIVLVLIAIFLGWFYLVKKKQKGGNLSSSTVKPFIEVVTDRLHDSVTDVKVDRAIIGSETDARRRELEEVKKEPDGKKRRDRLASILRKSL